MRIGVPVPDSLDVVLETRSGDRDGDPGFGLQWPSSARPLADQDILCTSKVVPRSVGRLAHRSALASQEGREMSRIKFLTP